jgi:FkbM family methyltransferase
MHDNLSEIALTLELLRPYKIDRPLVRIGPRSDGGYILPDDLNGITDCFSAGVGDSSEFEEALLKYGIQTHLLDGSVSGPANNHKATSFISKFLGRQTNREFISVYDWINLTSGENSELLLKIDIEGSEYDVLESVRSKFLERFRIIIIEFHKTEVILNNNFRPKITEILRTLNKTHSCIHIHPNNNSRVLTIKNGDRSITIPRVFEVTFYRNDRFSILGAKETFKVDLDVRNVSSKPELNVPETMFLETVKRKDFVEINNVACMRKVDNKKPFKHISIDKYFNSLSVAPSQHKTIPIVGFDSKTKGEINCFVESPKIYNFKKIVIAGEFPVVIDTETSVLVNEKLTHRDYDAIWHALPNIDYYSGAKTQEWIKYYQKDETYSVSLPPLDYSVRGTSIFLGGSRNFGHNLWEWMVRLPAITPLTGTAEFKFLYYEDSLRMREAFEICFPDYSYNLLPIPRMQPVEVDNLYFPTAPFRRNSSKDLIVHPDSLVQLRKLLRTGIKCIPNCLSARGIFITRRTATIRRLINTDEIAAVLADFGIVEVSLEDMSLNDQICLISECEIVVSVFGAGSALAALAPRSAMVVELSPSSDIFGMYNGVMSAGILGQRFERIFGQPVLNPLRSSRGSLFDDFTLPETEINRLRSLLSRYLPRC